MKQRKYFSQGSQETEMTLDEDRNSHNSGHKPDFSAAIAGLIKKVTKSERKRDQNTNGYIETQENISSILQVLEKVPMKKSEKTQVSSSSFEMMSDSDESNEKVKQAISSKLEKSNLAVNSMVGQDALKFITDEIKSLFEEMKSDLKLQIKEAIADSAVVKDSKGVQREADLKLEECRLQEYRQSLNDESALLKSNVDLLQKERQEFEVQKLQESENYKERAKQLEKEIFDQREILINEKHQFQIRRCEWDADKRLLIQRTNLERKECAKLKSELESKLLNVKSMEQELEQSIQQERETLKIGTNF